MSILFAFIASVLFALVTPLSKIILTEIDPVFMAGLCYLSSALGLGIYRFFTKIKEPSITINDIPQVAGIIVFGGILAPIFLFKGISIEKASTVSIFLNLEVVFTTLLAVIFLNEDSSLKFWVAVFLLFLSIVFINFDYNFKITFSKGSLFVILACIMWALDNILTTKLSIKDPYIIAIIKGIVGGGFNLIYYFINNDFSYIKLNFLPSIILIGIFGYGVSLIFLIYSMRYVGAAKSVAVFGCYPVLSFIFSVLILKESFTFFSFLAFMFMFFSIVLIFFSKHEHKHIHLEKHSHIHSHNDGHHNHIHENINPEVKHSHFHEHNIEHTHPHYSDLHHKHH